MSATSNGQTRGGAKHRSHPFLRDIHYWLGWLSRNFPSGKWDSHYLGRGYDFQGIVPYRDDPDLLRTNWQATLIMDEPQVNVFSEERNVSIYLLANVGPSMAFGSEETKLERLALLAAILSYSAYRAKDYFRFIGYTDEVELGFPKPRDQSYPLILYRAILNFDWRGKRRGGLVRAVSRLPNQKCLVVIVSDHLGQLDGTRRALRALKSAGHDVLPIILWDERETKFPGGWGFLPLQDLETGEVRHVLVSPRSRRILERNIAERKKEIVELFRGFGIEPHFFVHTSEDLEERDRGQDSGEDKEHRTEPSSRASALLEKDMAKLVRIFMARQARL